MVIATRYLNPGEIQELETAIASVEQETSAEIVCAVATSRIQHRRRNGLTRLSRRIGRATLIRTTR